MPYDSVLLAAPRRLPQSFHRLNLPDGREVRMLMLHFLDAQTRVRIETAETQEQRLAAAGADRLSV